MLAWMAWVALLRGKGASMVGVGGVCDLLAWVVWVGLVVCLSLWHASADDMSGVLTWKACYYYCYCYYLNTILRNRVLEKMSTLETKMKKCFK